MSGDVRYSICSTHFNNEDLIEDSAGVMADLIEGRDEWELVISDAGSTDGSLEYLRDLETSQDDVRVVVAEGTSIGGGRQVALDHAEGDVIISLGDLDARYHDDDRLFAAVEFYEQLVADEGDVLMGGPFMVGSKDLIEELGGWNDLETMERRDLKRRALREGKLRFCDFSIVAEHPGKEKGFFEALERFYTNARMKLKAGMSLPYLVGHWIREAPGVKPKVGAVIVFPVAWIHNLSTGTERIDTFDRRDPYALDFQRSVERENPDIWLDPSGPLEEYV